MITVAGTGEPTAGLCGLGPPWGYLIDIVNTESTPLFVAEVIQYENRLVRNQRSPTREGVMER
jgi:hypothetical protein